MVIPIINPTHRQAHYAFWQSHNSRQKMRKELAFSNPIKKFPFPSFLFFQPTHKPTDNGRAIATATNKRFERKAGKVLRLYFFGKKKVLSSYQHLSVKSALCQAAKTL